MKKVNKNNLIAKISLIPIKIEKTHPNYRRKLWFFLSELKNNYYSEFEYFLDECGIYFDISSIAINKEDVKIIRKDIYDKNYIYISAELNIKNVKNVSRSLQIKFKNKSIKEEDKKNEIIENFNHKKNKLFNEKKYSDTIFKYIYKIELK